MEKWIRRTIHATVGAGVVAVGASGLANADETIVTPDVKSESTAVLGDNSILGGNSLSAPIVAPITGNDVAVAGVGGAVNADDVLAVLGILGNAHSGSCGHDDTTVVAPKVRSSSSSVAGDNSIGSANNASVPVVVPVTDNKVAVAGIGGAVNGEDVSLIGGIVGNASCDGDGSNDDGYGDDTPYLSAQDESYTTDALPLVGGALPLGAGQVLGTATGLVDSLPVAPTSAVDDVMSMVGLASLDGLTNLVGLGGLTDIGGLGAATDVVDNVADTATSTVSPQTAEQSENTELATETAELSSSDPVATTHAAGGGDTTVVAPKVKSSSTSVVGDNSILSGNSLSAPIVAPVTDNDVAVAGIGAAVNAESVDVVVGLLGTATSLLD